MANWKFYGVVESSCGVAGVLNDMISYTTVYVLYDLERNIVLFDVYVILNILPYNVQQHHLETWEYDTKRFHLKIYSRKVVVFESAIASWSSVIQSNMHT